MIEGYDAVTDPLDEIYRLKSELRELRRDALELQSELRKVRALCARAADALEDWSESPASSRLLIAELREAAK